MHDAVSTSMSMNAEANSSSASTSMLKKSLDFQGDMANSLINDSVNAADSQLRTESMNKAGKGQNLNITA